MTSTAAQITNLMMSNAKSASEMTHALKVLGGGSMQKGFARIGAYFAKEAAIALTRGRLQGGLVGVLGTVIVGGITLYAVNKRNQKTEHENEGQKILQAMTEEPLSQYVLKEETGNQEPNETEPAVVESDGQKSRNVESGGETYETESSPNEKSITEIHGETLLPDTGNPDILKTFE